MIRQIFVIATAVIILAAPSIARAQAETMSYSDTMRKHGKSTTTHAAKHGASGAAHVKGGKAAGGKKSRGKKG